MINNKQLSYVELPKFDKWLLAVSDRSYGCADNDDIIQMPPNIVVQSSSDPGKSNSCQLS